MRYAVILTGIAALAVGPAGAQRAQSAAPCCGITKIDAATGLVTARVTANQQEFQFKVTDARILASLKVGQGVYANFTGKQASLDGRSACCAITSGPSAPAAAVPPRQAAVSTSAPSPAAAPPQATSSAATSARADTRTRVPDAGADLPTVKSVSFASGRQAMVAVKGGSEWQTTGGQEAVLRVELTAPAPCVEHCGGAALNGQRSGYMPVLVSGNNAAQFNVQRVLVPTDKTIGEVRFLTIPVTASTPVTVSAWRDGSAPRQAVLSVLPPVMTSFVIDKTSVMGGEVVHGTVTFTGPPASSNAVKFSLQTTNSQVLRIPAAVTLAMNTTAVTFDIVARGVEQDKSAQVVATFQDKLLPVSVDVRATALTDIDRFFPCCDNPFRIILKGSAPPQGAVIQLSSENPARMVVPPTVTIQPDSSSTSLSGQSIPGNSATSVTITASYNGVSKRYSLRSPAIIKPDLVVEAALADRFGNAITAPQDGQPFKLCATVKWQRPGESAPNVPVPPSVLRVSYRSPTGTGTSTGRDIDFPISFGSPTEAAVNTACLELPGLGPGASTDVTLTADFRKEVDEDRESNNERELKIVRPPSE